MALFSLNNFTNTLRNSYSTKPLEPNLPQQPAHTADPSPKEIFEKYGEKRIVFSWSAPIKFNRFSLTKRSMRSMSIIGIVIALILAMMGEIMLLLVIGSMIFAIVVFNRSGSEDSEYLITSHGLILEEKLYYWYQLEKFFFMEQGAGEKILVFDTYMTFPKRLFVPLSLEVDLTKLQDYLASQIMFVKEPPTDALDRTYRSVMSKFDL